MKGPAATQVISKSYQTGLIIKCGLLFAGGLILTGIILYFSAQQPLGPSYQESFARLSQLKQEMLVKSVITYCILLLVVMGGVIFITVLYSHRVVGPLVGLKRALNRIGSGDLSQPVVLRQKDAIKPMADALNDMMKKYNETIGQVKVKTGEMRAISDGTDQDGRAQEIEKRGKELNTLLNSLKL